MCNLMSVMAHQAVLEGKDISHLFTQDERLAFFQPSQHLPTVWTAENYRKLLA